MGVGVSVRVIVAAMVVLVALNGRGATVRHFTVDTLELEGGVVDAEFLPKRPIDLLQDATALRRRDVGNDDVSGTGVGLGTETPDVQVVDVLNAVDGLQRNAYLRQGTTPRRSLQEDVQRLPNDGQRTP